MKFAYKAVFIWIQILLVLYTNLKCKIKKECFPLSVVFLEIKKKYYETTGKNKDKIIFQIHILRM